MDHKTEKLLVELKEKIAAEAETKVEIFLADLYPADIAELLKELSTAETRFVLPYLPLQKIAFSLTELDPSTRRDLLNFLEAKQLRVILDNMYADDIADLIEVISIGKSKELLELMKQEDAQQIQDLLGYDEESAGGIMTTEYIAIKEDKTAQQALATIRKVATKAEMIYYLYVVNSNQKLVGVMSMRELITADPTAQITDLMQEQVIDVPLDLDQEEVANIISKYDLLAIPVVNEEQQLLGIITVDDALDVIEEEATEDIYKMAATEERELDAKYETILGRAFKRLPWLTILLFASMLSGTVIGNFSSAISSVVALTFFIPTLTGTGGNAGTQSLAIVVRGLGTGDIDPQEIGLYLWNEFKVGGVTALWCGLIIGLVATLWQASYMLGIVVGVAMFCTILWATIVGTIMPFLINYLGADPAVAAGPFITTLIDVSGLFIYFSLAKLFIEYLM
ncbi:magnesium transporter [Halanaerobaculum tunisiense]